MAPSRPSRVVIERNASCLRGVVLIDRTLQLYQECASDDAAACRALLEAVRHAAGDTRTTVALIASAAQGLQRLTAAKYFPDDPEELHAAVNPQTGAATTLGRPAIALTAPAGELESFEAWLVAGRLDEPALLSSSVAEFGAMAQLLPPGSKARIAVWHLSGTPAAVSVVGSQGVDAVLPCTVAWADLIEAIRLTLNLRATAAVTKFLFNDLFDFSDVAPRIAQILAGPIKAALASLSDPPTAFHISGLSRRQGWLARQLAASLGLPHWEPDAKVILQTYGVTLASTVSATSLPLGVLPLLHAAVADPLPRPWLAPWLTAEEILAQLSRTVIEAARPIPPVAAAEVSALAGASNRVAWSVPPAPPATVEPPADPVVVAVAAPPTLVLPPPRPTVRIGARKLVLAPNTPSPLTGWPQPVQRHAAVAELPSALRHEPAPGPESPREDLLPPEPPPDLVGGPATPAAAPRRRQRVLYMTGVAVVLAAVNAVTYFNREPDPSSLPAAEVTNAPPAALDPTTDALQRVEDVAFTTSAEFAHPVDSPTATLSSMELGHPPPLPWLSGSAHSWKPAPLHEFGGEAEPDFSRRWWGGEPAWQFVPTQIQDAHQTSPAEPTPSTGTLQIVSSRADWKYTLINALGEKRAVSPGSIDTLPTGEYVLEVSQTGWAPLQEKVQISAGATATLTPKFVTGRLLVRTVPEGADVSLNGRPIGRTPFELTNLPAGPFEMVLSLADHDDVVLGGEVMAGATTELSFQLDRLDRLARVSELATPPVATVRVAPNFGRLPLIKSGRVLLSFIIDRTGTPSGIRVEDASDRRLIRPCLDVLTSWKFSPGINREGKPVNTRVHQLFQVAVDE